MVEKPSAESRRQDRLARAYARRIRVLERLKANERSWFERDGGARLAHDAALLVERGFSGLVHEIRGKQVVLGGVLPIVTGVSGITHQIATEIRFENTYPSDEPKAYDAAMRFSALPGRPLADRHLAEDGLCCLWLQSRSEWVAADPDALIHYLRQLLAFFERQLIYDVIKRWPGPEYAHGSDGYAQDIRETLGQSPRIISLYERILRGGPKPRRRDLCPCGSAKLFVTCHKLVFADLDRRTPWHVLNDVRSGVMTLQPQGQQDANVGRRT
jgi:hypothetical protein